MKSALGFVAILFAAVLVADARRYARDGSSGSSQQSSGEKSRLQETFEELKEGAEELKKEWEEGSQDVTRWLLDIKDILKRTKDTIMKEGTNLEDLTSLLNSNECEIMGDLFKLKDILPENVDFSDADDFEQAKKKLLTQITTCDLNAFEEINGILQPVTSGSFIELYCQLNRLVDVLKQLQEAAKDTAGLVYLKPEGYDTKEKFETMMEGARDNAEYAIVKMMEAGVCQPKPETNETPARRRFQHARNLMAKLRHRHIN